jgi:hypothetical protein
MKKEDFMKKEIPTNIDFILHMISGTWRFSLTFFPYFYLEQTRRGPSDFHTPAKWHAIGIPHMQRSGTILYLSTLGMKLSRSTR